MSDAVHDPIDPGVAAKLLSGSSPMAVCHSDGEPLIATLLFDGAEFACQVCGRLYGWLGPKAVPSTPELEARQRELEAAFDADHGIDRRPTPLPEYEGWAPWSPNPTPDRHGWARTALVSVERGAVPLVDGKQVNVAAHEQVHGEWYDSVKGDMDGLRDNHDTVGAQRVAAWAYQVARENPHDLPHHLLAGWQAHAASVARSARADYIRDIGGTGVELKAIEQCGATAAEAAAARDELAGDTDAFLIAVTFATAAGCGITQAAQVVSAVLAEHEAQWT